MSRFPEFMWQNDETLNFIKYLRDYNQGKENKIGFFGLDIFGLSNCLDELELSESSCTNDDNNQHISKRCLDYITKLKLRKESENLNIYICSKVINTLIVFQKS